MRRQTLEAKAGRPKMIAIDGENALTYSGHYRVEPRRRKISPDAARKNPVTRRQKRMFFAMAPKRLGMGYHPARRQTHKALS